MRSFLLFLFFLLGTSSVAVNLNGQCTPIPVIYSGLAVALPPSGTVPVPASVFDAGSIDNCETGGLIFSFTHLISDDNRIFDCEDLGEQSLYIYTTDQFSNQNLCSTHIHIQEGIISCAQSDLQCGPAIITYEDLNVDISYGPVTVDAAIFDAGSLDLCESGGLTFEISRSETNEFSNTLTIDCEDQFSILIYLRVTDGFGNQNTIPTRVFVSDYLSFCNGNPSIDPCGPAPLRISTLAVGLPENGQIGLPASTVFLNEVDSCGNGNIQIAIARYGELPNYEQENLNLSCNDDYFQPILAYVRYNDDNEIPSSVELWRQDNLPPEVICNDLIVDLEAPNVQTLTPQDFMIATDNCPGLQLGFSISPIVDELILDCTMVGINSILVHAVDRDFNVSACSVNLIVNDPQGFCSGVECNGESFDFTGIIGPGVYRFSDHATASGVVNQSVSLQAGNFISLLPGFSAPAGTTFSAIIAPCAPPLALIPEVQVTLREKKMELRVFPNPFQFQSRMQLSLPEPAPLKIRLLDHYGKVLKTLADLSLFTGDFWEGRLEDPTLPSGMYYLHIQSGEQLLVKKVVRY